MKTNAAGLAIIKKTESCVLTAYPDPGSPDGKPTSIGWGTTRINGQPVPPDLTITQEQADAYLAADLAGAEEDVARLVTVPLNENQASALNSMVYNIGAAQFASSTLLRLLNARDYGGAANQFGRWVNGAGGPLPGLITRRAAERALFLTPVVALASAPAEHTAQPVPPPPIPEGYTQTSTGNTVIQDVSKSTIVQKTSMGEKIAGASVGVTAAGGIAQTIKGILNGITVNDVAIVCVSIVLVIGMVLAFFYFRGAKNARLEMAAKGVA